jgi:glucose-6-phosphate 1-dehydrogenase
VVIFGASGDLTARKLGPAVENLARHKRIPAEFGVVGVARTQMAPADFRSRMAGAEGSVMPALYEGFRYVAGGYDDPDAYAGCGKPSTRSTSSAGPPGTGCSTSPRREAFGPAPSCSPPC